MLIPVRTPNDKVKSIRCRTSHLFTTPSLRFETDETVRNMMRVCKACYSGEQIGPPEDGSLTR